MRELDNKEGQVLKNWCFQTVVLEKILESPLDWTEIKSVNPKGNQSVLKEISLNIHWKDWSWSSKTLATWYEELTHWRTPWCWEKLRAKGEGDDRGWYGWMASLTQWTCVTQSWRQWWTEEPGVLQFMGSQRIGCDLATEQHHHHHIYMCLWVSKISDSQLASTLKEGSWYLRRNKRGETTI